MMDQADGDRSLDLDDIVAAMGDGVLALDPDGAVIDLNEPLAAMAGYDPEELREAGPELIYDQTDYDRFEAAIRDMLSEGGLRTVPATIRAADGSDVPVEVTMSTILEDGEFHGTISVIRDVTERRHRQRELERYEAIVEAMPDEVYTLDPDGYYTDIIPAAGAETTATGYRPEELVGQHVSTVLDEDDRERGRQRISTLLSDPDRNTVSFEVERISKDGERVPHEIHVAALPPGEDGEFRGTVGVVRDISERVSRKEALERRNERLEEFAKLLSHDLRNPLSVATGFVELLQEDIEDERLDAVADAHDRMADLIENILDRARAGQPPMDPTECSLASVAEQAWSTVRSGDANLTIEADANIIACETRFRRVLENLFRNAVEHAGPEVHVRVGVVERDETVCGFYVEDDGPGIPPEERADVLESGYSTVATGTGLGLAVVERIATGHDWTLAVGEASGGGARFEFTEVEFA